MKQLFIAEKPNVARAICEGFGGDFSKKDGYYEKGNIQVTWCYGHMLELFESKDYDEKYEKWNSEDLPLSFFPYQLKVKDEDYIKKQLKVIKTLLNDCDEVVNAGDPDDEGQLLVDEIIRFYDIKKPVKRVLINDNTPAVVAKSLADIKPNSDFEYMGYIALSRSLADQYFGINLSRAYTLKFQAMGGASILSVGRVQSVMLGLIVSRCLANRNHKKSYYYNVLADVTINGLNFQAKYKAGEDAPVDEKKRLINKEFASNIAENIKGKSVKVSNVTTKKNSKAPPLPYNLVKLQQDCSKSLGLNPDETDKIAQQLYEKHTLITYVRSDSQYLSDEQFDDANTILQAVANIDENYQDMVDNCNPTLKSGAFNTKKVSAHHGIVPTLNKPNISNLSDKEKAVYKLIAKRYILQFYPNHEYETTKLTLDIDGHLFLVSAKVDLDLGWRNLGADDVEDKDKNEDDLLLDLRNIKNNDVGSCVNSIVKDEQTKPLPLYTMASFVGDLTNVAKYVKDPKLSKVLKERDKDKKGENGGIGTPATRSAIIQTLFDRGFIEEIGKGKSKKIVCTKLGEQFYKQLSDVIKYPDMTAIWFEQQKLIKTEDDAIKFVKNMMKQIVEPEVERIIKNQLKMPSHKCNKCGRVMIRKKGKRGLFWGCTGYGDEQNPCNNIVADDNGKPNFSANTGNSGARFRKRSF